MSLTVNRAALAAALATMQSVIERRTTAPILACVLVDASDGTMRILATDLDMKATIALPADGGLDFVAVNGERLKTAVDGMNAETIAIVVENGSMVITAGRARRTLPTLPAADMPVMEVSKYATSFEVEPKQLAAAIGFASPAMSTEETRYYLNGIFIHTVAETDGIRLVACDGHQLRRIDIRIASGSPAMSDAIMPRKIANLLAKMLDRHTTPLTIKLSSNMIHVDLGSTTLTSKLIDGTYPDYSRTIPTDRRQTLNASGAELARAAGATTAMGAMDGQKVRVIVLNMSAHEARLTASGVDGNADEPLTYSEWNGADMRVGFNGRYLANAAASFGDETIDIHINDPAAPVVITAASHPEALAVIMPMRV